MPMVLWIDSLSVESTRLRPIDLAMPGGNTRTTVFMKPYPIYAARGEGCRVIDDAGNRYIDGLSGLYCTNLGHSHGDELGRAALSQDQARDDLARLVGDRDVQVNAHTTGIQFVPAVASGTWRPGMAAQK